jgi:hypothetical protein
MPVTASPRWTGISPARLAARRSILFSPLELGRPPVSSAAIAASPVDRGCRGAVVDEAPEITAFGPASVGDDQPSAGFECVEAVSVGAERDLER